MIDHSSNSDAISYDPASMTQSSLSLHKAIWYRRPWILVTLSIVVIAAISIITDLPHPLTNAQDADAQNASITEINKDVTPCAFAVQEDFRFYREKVAGTMTPSQLATAIKYLPLDQTVCSFAGPAMYDLTNNLQVLDTTAGKQIDKMSSTIVTWMDSDANGAIADIQSLFANPTDAKSLRDLRKRETNLANDQALAMNDLSTADAILGVQLQTLKLPILSNLPGI